MGFHSLISLKQVDIGNLAELMQQENRTKDTTNSKRSFFLKLVINYV